LELTVKQKLVLFLTVLSLALAAMACQFPWNAATPTPTATEAAGETPVTPTETTEITQPPTSPTETATATLTETPTEEPAPALPVFPSPVIFNFSFFTPTKGWAVTQDTNYLLVTVDAGATWLDATPTDLSPLPAGVSSLGLDPFFLDEHTAWFTPFNAGGTTGRIYQTLDGGVSWSVTPVPFNNARYFFLNLTSGYALVSLGVGAGSQYVAVYQTIDGGANWTEVFTHEPGVTKSLPSGGSKGGFTFLDINQGWISGNNPMTDYFYLFTTVDGGMTWAQETDISLPAAYAGSFLDTWSPFFMSNTVAYLPVRALTSGGDNFLLIYRSDDSGQTWAFQSAVPDGRAVDFTMVDTGWVCGGTALLKTTDGGLTWSSPAMAGIPPADFILNLDFVDDLNGWALTTPDDYTWSPLRLFRTTDGGATWTPLLP
jgi:photosystem II stability/assembly factor-like uncharacterized protein